MTVVLSNKNNFMKKLSNILATAKARDENNIIVLVEGFHYESVSDKLKSVKSIGRIKMGLNTFFIIKEMRLEVKPIDYYI